jgi:hypothetical protein
MRSVGDGISKAECCASVELGKIFSIRQVCKFAIIEISGRVTKYGTLHIDIFSRNLVLMDRLDYLHGRRILL